MKSKKRGWIAGIAGAAVLLVLLAVFFVSSKEFYMGRFSASVVASNTDVSAMTVEEALASMNDSEGLTVLLNKEGQEFQADISPAVTRVFDSRQVEESKDEISFLDYLLHRDVVISVKPTSAQVERKELKACLEEVLPEPVSYTADAYFDKDLEFVSEVQGDDVNYSALLDQIASDILAGNELVYDLSEFYNQPQVKEGDAAIADAREKIANYKKMSITFTFGEEEETISGNKISKHLVYKNGKLKLKKKWIGKFVRQMASKYNTYGKTRKFHSTKDGVVKIKGGIMGWWIDETATVKKIKKLLAKQKTKTLEPVYRNVAAQHGKDDIGSTYVEISLKRQKLWFYKEGKLKMQSDVVTGLPTSERATVKGVHRIYGMEKNRYLGTIAVQGYRSFVNYWMPFNWDGQGLHDATWRSRFGGNLYQSGGSHGCVNMPIDKAAKLYSLVTIGTPVIVY